MRRRLFVLVALAAIVAPWRGGRFLRLPSISRARAQAPISSSTAMSTSARSIFPFKVAGRDRGTAGDADEARPRLQQDTRSAIATLDKPLYFEDELRIIARARESEQEDQPPETPAWLASRGDRPSAAPMSSLHAPPPRSIRSRATGKGEGLLKTAVTSQQSYEHGARGGAPIAGAACASRSRRCTTGRTPDREPRISRRRARSSSLEQANVVVAERNLADAELVAPWSPGVIDDARGARARRHRRVGVRRFSPLTLDQLRSGCARLCAGRGRNSAESSPA